MVGIPEATRNVLAGKGRVVLSVKKTVPPIQRLPMIGPKNVKLVVAGRLDEAATRQFGG
jgi:hypothetical protein